MNKEQHWERIYQTKASTEVSWYQPKARLSLGLIGRVAPKLDDPVLDVGGGASTLVHEALTHGHPHFPDIHHRHGHDSTPEY
jgi:hypothetical protein